MRAQVPVLALIACIPVLAQTAPLATNTLIQETRAALETRIKAYRAHVAAGKPRSEFNWDFRKELASIEAALAAKPAEDLRQALEVARFGYRIIGRQKLKPAEFEALRGVVPAASAAWAIHPSLITDLAENLTDEKAASAYLAEARTHSPVAEVRATLLLQHFEEALEAKDAAAWKVDLAHLEKDHAGSAELESARKELVEFQKTAVGTAAPAFSVPVLGEAGKDYSLATFKGKYVLIDFWATWCPYCVAELPAIHKAWARFKDRNFEILSLSFDQKAEDIAPFRQKPGTPMPWKHAFIAGAKKSAVGEAYGVVGIPKTVLVGPDGKIVATDGELKGEQLERTLETFLK